MEKIIFHIDVNSAFLSWTAVEMLKQGSQVDIREIPAIIGGDQESRHGVVLAKSVLARKYGVKTGEPVANALRKCPKLHIEPPNHSLYQAYSRKLMEFLRTYTTDIEQVSIDECFMDFTGISKPFSTPMDAAFEIQQEVYEKFGFTVNIGISNNKLLAKMASDFEKPNRIHTLFPEEIKEKMWPLPVGELFMAGKSSVDVLHKLEIDTIGDLAQTEPELLELHLKSHGRMLWEFANGKGASELQLEERVAKGIGNSMTLSRDVVEEEKAREILFHLAEKVGNRLQKAGQKAKMVSVEIKYSDFTTTSHQKQLVKATDITKEIYQCACKLFCDLWNLEPIRLLGVRTSKLVEEEEPEQLTIFDMVKIEQECRQERYDREKQEKLKQALDTIKQRYGEDAIVKGAKRK